MPVERKTDKIDEALAGELVAALGLVVRIEELQLKDLLSSPTRPKGVFARLGVELALDKPVELGLHDQHLRRMVRRRMDEHVAQPPELQHDFPRLLGIVLVIAPRILLAVQPQETRDLEELPLVRKLIQNGSWGLKSGKVFAFAQNVTQILERPSKISDELRRLIDIRLRPFLRVADPSENPQLLHVTLEVAAQVRAGLSDPRNRRTARSAEVSSCHAIVPFL